MLCLLEKVVSETYFVFFNPILFYDILDNMIYLVNADTVFILDDGETKELYFWGFIGRYNKVLYQNICLVFKRKPYSMLPWVYHMSQLKE